MGYLEQEAKAGFSAHQCWEARIAATILLAALSFCAAAPVNAGSFQEKAPAKDATSGANATPKAPVTGQTKAEPGAQQSPAEKPAPAKPKPGKRTWRVLVVSDVPIPSVSVHAKKAPLSEVTAEIGRQLKIPIILSPTMKQQQLTTDFENFTVETAVRLLAPRAIVDYVISGGNGPLASKKEPVAIYLMAYDEKPPRQGPFVANKSGAQLVVGTVYATADEEKVALEEKAQNLQVSLKEGLITLKVQKQYLTDVLEMVAGSAGIPFAILTTDGGQKELEEVVTWSIDKVTLEELTRTWFPNNIRLYWRTDLESYDSRPIRLTIEPMDSTQVERVITP